MSGQTAVIRRIAIVLAGMALLGAFATSAMSQEDFEEHPHMLVIGLELDEFGEPIGLRRCVDLAANQALPNTAHHENVHFGQARQVLFEKGGHLVVPGAPFPAPFAEPLPWSNCAELIAFFFGD
ncbi:hypothetical protein [Nitriliruptor alkaliphilus]|uniref:hypothetical protein n=1 Tax=Nitriliruptor alkaliphilus TaxID=427918 RepID=UPI0012ED4DFE|nr:hypothetical protein [Nitriliruptor alkaliphilus]